MSNQENIPSTDIPDDYKDMLSNINSFVNDANNSNVLSCGKECQKNIVTNEAYNTFIAEKDNLVNAPKLFEEAERNYITLTKGNQYYEKMKETEYEKEFSEFEKEMNKKAFDMLMSAGIKIGSNKTITDSMKNVNELRNTYSEKIADLKTDIADNENISNLANRQSYYSTKKIYKWCTVNYYLKILFWFLFIGYVLMVIFSRRYTEKYVKTVLILVPLLAALNGHMIYLYLSGSIKKIMDPVTTILKST